MSWAIQAIGHELKPHRLQCLADTASPGPTILKRYCATQLTIKTVSTKGKIANSPERNVATIAAIFCGREPFAVERMIANRV